MLEDPASDISTMISEIRDLVKSKKSIFDPKRRQEVDNIIAKKRDETGLLALKNLYSLQRLANSDRVKKVMDLLRKHIPKYFFKCVNRQLSFNQGQRIMI